MEGAKNRRIEMLNRKLQNRPKNGNDFLVPACRGTLPVWFSNKGLRSVPEKAGYKRTVDIIQVENSTGFEFKQLMERLRAEGLSLSNIGIIIGTTEAHVFELLKRAE